MENIKKMLGDAYEARDAYYKARDVFDKASEAYYKAKFSCVDARDAYYKARDAYYKAREAAEERIRREEAKEKATGTIATKPTGIISDKA